jgi:hypothetical protein
VIKISIRLETPERPLHFQGAQLEPGCMGQKAKASKKEGNKIK